MLRQHNWKTHSKGFANVLGIPTLQTGVFGGIIGALAAWCYNKFYNISLPSYLGFFAGKRFVPIMMATTSFILAFQWLGFGHSFKMD